MEYFEATDFAVRLCPATIAAAVPTLSAPGRGGPMTWQETTITPVSIVFGMALVIVVVLQVSRVAATIASPGGSGPCAS